MSEIVVEFSADAQGLGPLREAAYRLIGQASCHIDSTPSVHACRLTPSRNGDVAAADVRSRFLDLVTDENLREKLRMETARTRDVIVALAFGALAEADKPASSA